MNRKVLPQALSIPPNRGLYKQEVACEVAARNKLLSRRHHFICFDTFNLPLLTGGGFQGLENVPLRHCNCFDIQVLVGSLDWMLQDGDHCFPNIVLIGGGEDNFTIVPDLGFLVGQVKA